MSRKTIQPNQKFRIAVRNIQNALQNHRIRLSRYQVKPTQSGPPPVTPKTGLTRQSYFAQILGINNIWAIAAFRWFQGADIAVNLNTDGLKRDLEEQISNKTDEVVSGVKALELRAVALQSQVLNGLRRRGARRQLNRLDRIARAGWRRELLASNNGPLQSVLVKRVEDTLARVNSST